MPHWIQVFRLSIAGVGRSVDWLSVDRLVSSFTDHLSLPHESSSEITTKHDSKGTCGEDENEVAHANDVDFRCPHQVVARGVKYCCKKEKPPLSNCHWVGQGHCDDITCNPDEVTAKRSLVGDGVSCRCKR